MTPSTKNFRKRNAIYDCLCNLKTHPSAEDIYTRLKPEIPDLSLATVYRNINLFRQQGLAICVATVDGVERYDGNVHPHVHFICTDCNAVIDLTEMKVPQSLTSAAESSVGGMVTECQLSFTGRCRGCVNTK